MLTRLSELARDTYSTSCEFREAARPCTHAVTIRFDVTAVDAIMCRRWISAPEACQATAGATSVERSRVMLPRSVRVGTIHTSAAEVRDRSRPAHGAFYSTISLSGYVYITLAGKGLTTKTNHTLRTNPRNRFF